VVPYNCTVTAEKGGIYIMLLILYIYTLRGIYYIVWGRETER
jgi:hypothetical protein